MDENEKVMEETKRAINEKRERLSDESDQRDVDLDLHSAMFDDIGAKIKGLATVNTWIGIIASIIIAFIMIPNEDVTGWGFAILICGPLLSWISSTTIYGFGQLVENSDKIVQLLKNK